MLLRVHVGRLGADVQPFDDGDDDDDDWRLEAAIVLKDEPLLQQPFPCILDATRMMSDACLEDLYQ
jgi:hypothetical protein